MAETMALTLEGRFDDYTLGKNIELWRVREIEQIAAKHGFRLSGLRSFEREVTAEHIAECGNAPTMRAAPESRPVLGQTKQVRNIVLT
jgi:hypothetical protein